MLRKIWFIARRELYETYTDTNLLLIMIATPLALATIIGLALGGTSDGSGFQNIPVVIVNQDTGDQGDILVNILIPTTSDSDTSDDTSCRVIVEDGDDDADTQSVSLEDLLAAEKLDNIDTARAGVEAWIPQGLRRAASPIRRKADRSGSRNISQEDPKAQP
jgi:hypothetical protein